MRKAFTLIELLVSISLMSIIIMLLYQSANQTKMSNKSFLRFYDMQKKQTKLRELFFRDFFEAKKNSIKIISAKERGYDILYLKTSNSIKGFFEPLVMYYVTREDNTLIRVESYKKLSIGNINLDQPFKASLIEKNIKKFKVFKNKDKYLIYLQLKNSDPLIINIKTL